MHGHAGHLPRGPISIGRGRLKNQTDILTFSKYIYITDGLRKWKQTAHGAV